MESGEVRTKRTRRRWRVVLCLLAVLLLIVVIAVVLGVTLSRTGGLKPVFLNRCQKFKEQNCQHLWDVFKQAYVNRNACEVPVKAYDPLITAAPFTASCGRMVFWSKTKNVVHEFTAKRSCFKTMEDTVLGTILDGLNWCGKEGSDETFTTGCPEWTECENNPVRSFWSRASAGFADAACGNVTVLLNGSITTPFHPLSIFASIETKRLNSTRVKNLNVVLVTNKNSVTNCTNGSLQDLKNALDKGIAYNCKEVQESQFDQCSSQPGESCGTCW